MASDSRLADPGRRALIAPGSGAGRAAGRDVATRADHGAARRAVDDVAAFGAGQGSRAVDHAAGAGGAARVTGRRRAGEGAVAPCFADALTVRAGPGAAAVRLARDVAGRGLAGECTRAAAATGASSVRAHGPAASVVAFAGRVAGRRVADEVAVVARRAGAGPAVTALDESPAGGRRQEEGDEGRTGQGGERPKAVCGRHVCRYTSRERIGFNRLSFARSSVATAVAISVGGLRGRGRGCQTGFEA